MHRLGSHVLLGDFIADKTSTAAVSLGRVNLGVTPAPAARC